MDTETYLNHPTFGLLFRVCLVEENRELFSTLYAQRLFFVVFHTAEGLEFEPIGRTDAKVLVENRHENVTAIEHVQRVRSASKDSPTYLSMIALKDHIAQFCANVPSNVQVIAVTKTVSVEAMREAYAAGIRNFGENRVQEAETKQDQLKDLTDVTWHLIGHLQSNKAQRAVERFDWIQSVDGLKLAQRLDRLAQERSIKPQICLQVKLMSDLNKSGFSVSELWEAMSQLEQLQHLQIRGLMAIPPFGLEADATIRLFEQAKELADKIQQQSHLQLDQLSMGMSDDYALAIQAGATMIRPGRVLFGART